MGLILVAAIFFTIYLIGIALPPLFGGIDQTWKARSARAADRKWRAQKEKEDAAERARSEQEYRRQQAAERRKAFWAWFWSLFEKKPKPPKQPTRTDRLRQLDAEYREDVKLANAIEDPQSRQAARAYVEAKRRRRIKELIG